MSQEPVKEGPFHAEPWGGGGSWAVQPGPIWEEGEFFFFSSPGEKEARRFAKDMNWAYALVQAALTSQPDEKCEGVLIFSAGMGEVNGKPGFVPNEPARMHCSGCGGSSGDGQGQQEAALRDYTPEEALKKACYLSGGSLGVVGKTTYGFFWGTTYFGLNGKSVKIRGEGDTFRAAFAKAEALSSPATPKEKPRSLSR